ncbi:pyridoxamine 5'-phosphate oxidase family protein [Microbacterium sp. zg.B48]|uniref:pyridoxamine 5'-phosphate oxidase family protein n=1 Tax=unclassified Microbacterium TaxID=2609290 RepID=UPI00214AC26F|nr:MULTISPECIES: pyridoxamine 5'-phosphate oxidase family protein [unclassified Microbacterium]MCR2763150.1 pyridoxamine 5'-phosphate oxidase family protein [Microbacterium sp. zg.B48]MCR2808739.1 pyridoxamine 5'-phosphate oxidase family protein [Microbacterium sp. zg.B185]WIM18831.1 pyridoxamine 5'-phosphate oxidase family protein [Microbacterium sp. zg-B185]
MPEFSDEAVTEMTEDECWHLLEHAQVGRLALCVGEEVDIFPLNFVVSEGALYFRTSPGSKLAALTANPRVALEADRYDDAAAASVVVKGVAERLELQRDIDAADQLPLQPWIPTLKYRWVRVVPTRVSGRLFARSPEPDRYDVVDGGPAS